MKKNYNWPSIYIYMVKGLKMENENKRYYSRCMYGNYKMDNFEEKASKNEEKGHPERFFGKDVIKALRRLAKMVLLSAIILFSLDGCKTQHTVIKEETITRYIDSTIWHTDTTYYQLPVEVYSDYTGLLDTLRLENTYSYTWSAVDTNKMILVGELRTNDIKIPVQYLWKDRIIYQDSIVESIKEVPTPYEVVKTKTPTWAWWTLFLCLLFIGYAGFKLYIKFWKP